MSEEDAALFWRADTSTALVSGEESAEPTLDSTEATPVRGLCLETTTLPEQARATNTPTMDGGIGKTASAETAQDTKPAVQSQATNTVVIDEIQGDEVAVLRLCQVTTGTQTESGDSSPEAETLNLKERVSEDVSLSTPIETTSFGPAQPKDIRVRRKGRRKDNPETLAKVVRTDPDL